LRRCPLAWIPSWGTGLAACRRGSGSGSRWPADRLLLLDEPTAHLDAITAAEILATIETLLADRTVVLVSHGPAWERQASQTITLDHGKLAALVPS